MNERFIFRVWHKEKEYMYKNVAVGVGKHKIGYKLSGKRRYSWEETDKIVILQYTGYEDSKGNKIFDGDILEFGSSKTYLATVHWVDYQFLFQKKDKSDYIDKFGHWGRVNKVKVVGNIYENPELLSDEEDEE